MPNEEDILEIKDRLEIMGYKEVKLENPCWEGGGVTIADPDGWRMVLMNTNDLIDKRKNKNFKILVFSFCIFLLLN